MIRATVTDVLTDPNYRKAELQKKSHMKIFQLSHTNNTY